MKITQQQMGLLKGLQEKDALILEIEKDRKNIPSMMKKAAAKLTLIQENEQLAKKQLEEAEMAHLQQEENLKNLEEQLKNGREKLEGIQNDREYKAANKEISQTINMIDESKTKIPQLLELVASAKE